MSEEDVMTAFRCLIGLALSEDIAWGDVTTEALVPPDIYAEAVLVAKQDLVVCGQEVAREVFCSVDSSLTYHVEVPDGRRVTHGSPLGVVSGRYCSILTAERTTLNFVQHLSGIATLTSQIVERVAHTKVKIRDTRKTTPGWRALEKYAVRVGGGHNHRKGLFDAFLIKNNHIDVCDGDIKSCVYACREHGPRNMRIGVEVRSMEELKLALAARPDSILLDNMSVEQLTAAVDYVKKLGLRDEIELEASGGINEQNVHSYAESGVNAISLGMLTHSARACDISLKYLNKIS